MSTPKAYTDQERAEAARKQRAAPLDSDANGIAVAFVAGRFEVSGSTEVAVGKTMRSFRCFAWDKAAGAGKGAFVAPAEEYETVKAALEAMRAVKAEMATALGDITKAAAQAQPDAVIRMARLAPKHVEGKPDRARIALGEVLAVNEHYVAQATGQNAEGKRFVALHERARLGNNKDKGLSVSAIAPGQRLCVTYLKNSATGQFFGLLELPRRPAAEESPTPAEAARPQTPAKPRTRKPHQEAGLSM